MRYILIFLFLMSANMLFAQDSNKKEVNKAPDATISKDKVMRPTKNINGENKEKAVKEEKKYESSIFKLDNHKGNINGVKYFIKDKNLKVPINFTVKDIDNDGGGIVKLSWKYLLKDKAESFEVLRRSEKEKEFKKITIIMPNKKESVVEEIAKKTPEKVKKVKKAKDLSLYTFRDDGLNDKLHYFYKIVVKKDGRFNETKEVKVQSLVAIFDANKTSVLIAAIFLTFAIVFFIKVARSGKKLYIRRIAGLDAVDDAVGRATEMGREIMFIPGIGDIDDPQTIAGLTILGRVAKLTAQYKTPLSVPVSKSMVMVTGREIVKESYLSMGRPENFQSGMVYYLTDDQFGFAAGVDGIMVREKPATIFLQGSFFAESLILAETGHHVGAIQISGTAAPSQLPFFITACDYTLMGEELYAASAYLSREPQLLGSLRGQDAGKAIILAAIIIGIVLETIAAVNPNLQWLSIKHYFHIK